jgi:type IV pilus assembly protein PilN
MAKINLLPWREAYRKEKKEEFLKIIGGMLIIAAFFAYVWVSNVQSAIDNQSARNQLLNSEIAKLELQVKEISDLKKVRDDLLARIKIIQDLQGTRPLIVRYFDDFAKAIPDGVFITSVIKKENVVTIKGIAESYNRVATLMRNLDASDWYADTKLTSVVADLKEGDQAQSFNMTTIASAPNNESNLEVAGEGKNGSPTKSQKEGSKK